MQPLPAAAAAAKLLQSCPTLCDPIDGSPPGSPILGILQARTLEWGAIVPSGSLFLEVPIYLKGIASSRVSTYTVSDGNFHFLPQ